MRVHLSHPERQIEVKGPKRVQDLLRDLNLLVEAHLVIRGSDLMTEDEVVADSDSIEVRPVISGGSSRQVNLPAGRGIPFHPDPSW
ncbi:MAG: thiamine biosynthesis protein ThiS [Nitrospiraceae bacterium]